MAHRVAVITGAGTGIGRACAIALAKDGFRIALAGRRREPLEAVAGELGAENALVFLVDVSQPDQVKNLFAQVKERWGRCDLLFNNAGQGTPATYELEDLPFELWKSVIDTNLTGMFLCTQEAIKLMKNNGGGRIINNGSISAYAPRPNSVAYTATKHAVSGLTKSTGLDCRKYNIACGQIDIGNAATGIFDKFRGGDSAAPTDTAGPRMGPPLKQPDGSLRPEPMIDVAEVAEAVRLMAKLPLDTNVLNLTIMARDMPFVGRG
ncbi:short-chain dehydrogenase [Hyaloraphidium curvatum]|nr:short-chain dehydrogenase [Hyaloraphidium curvatum]